MKFRVYLYPPRWYTRLYWMLPYWLRRRIPDRMREIPHTVQEVAGGWVITPAVEIPSGRRFGVEYLPE